MEYFNNRRVSRGTYTCSWHHKNDMQHLRCSFLFSSGCQHMPNMNQNKMDKINLGPKRLVGQRAWRCEHVQAVDVLQNIVQQQIDVVQVQTNWMTLKCSFIYLHADVIPSHLSVLVQSESYLNWVNHILIFRVFRFPVPFNWLSIFLDGNFSPRFTP